jgi:2-hydroxy-6-oxonona-2,4-dienedioate hydrolase
MAELNGKRIIAINRPGGGLSDGMDHSKVDFRKLAIEMIETVLDSLQIE